MPVQTRMSASNPLPILSFLPLACILQRAGVTGARIRSRTSCIIKEKHGVFIQIMYHAKKV